MDKGGRGVPWPHTGKREGGRLFQAAGPAKAKQSFQVSAVFPAARTIKAKCTAATSIDTK